MELKDDKTTELQRLKYEDCKFAMMKCFDLIRTMDRENVLNLIITLAIQHVDAFAVHPLDTETRGVLAVHLVKDMLERSENHLKDLPGDEDAQAEESKNPDEPIPVLQ